MNYQKTDNLLVQHLYKSGPFQEDIHPDHGVQGSFREWIQKRWCDCLCMRRTNRDKFFVKARSRLRQEIDIVNLLRQLRIFHLYVNSQVKPQDLLELRKQAEKEIILVENYKAYEMSELANDFAYRPRERRPAGTNLEHISDMESSLEQPGKGGIDFSPIVNSLGSQRSFVVPADGEKIKPKHKPKRTKTMPAKQRVKDNQVWQE